MLACAPVAWGQENGDDDDDEGSFEEADIFLELNHTDGDLGIHGLIDGDAWSMLSIESPAERQILQVKVKGILRRQGMTEIFFESDEPSFDELTPEMFFDRFPAGVYEIEGRTLEGETLESEAELSHVMPAPAANIVISGVPAAENCDAEPLPMIPWPVIITWDPVTTSHPDIGDAGPVEIAGYQFVVEREEPSLLVFSIDLPPNVTSMRVPGRLLRLSDEFKFEIVTREASGNQTAVESCFELLR
jgi:hypothetical protein